MEFSDEVLGGLSEAIEKGSCPADVLSVVTDESATTSTIIIPDSTEKAIVLLKKLWNFQTKCLTVCL